MTQKNNTENDSVIDSENIFDEFTDTDNIRNEINKTEKQKEKDIYYYLKKLNSFFLTVNVLMLIVLILGVLYFHVQEWEEKKEFSFLSPICKFILWNENITPGTCYWVSSILSEYEWRLSDEISNQSIEIFPILSDIYSLENYNLSKKVSFLLEKNGTRLKPLEILEAFDSLKNTFSPTDKQEISCYDISIREDILDITCDAFSSDWNTDIVTLNKWIIETLPWWGTSISRASSFMHFIENYWESTFFLLEKPANLSSISVQSWPYTRKTTFSLKMQYSSKDNLNF
jgi:hypothetical protein